MIENRKAHQAGFSISNQQSAISNQKLLVSQECRIQQNPAP
jgi:hypothetical protein